MALRRCLDCPELTSRSRCQKCARRLDRARGTRQDRGYDADYQRQLQAPDFVKATHCAECGSPFTAENPKTGGHAVALRHDGQGSKVLPHCRRCNYGWARTGL